MEEIIIKFVGKLIVGLKIAAMSIFGRVMGGLGMTFVNFQMVLPNVKSFLEAKLSGLPATAMQFVGACGFDIFIVLVVSAVIAKVGLRMITTTLASVQGLIAMEQGT